MNVPFSRPLYHVNKLRNNCCRNLTYPNKSSWSDVSGGGGGEQIILLFSKHVGEWKRFYQRSATYVSDLWVVGKYQIVPCQMEILRASFSIDWQSHSLCFPHVSSPKLVPIVRIWRNRELIKLTADPTCTNRIGFWMSWAKAMALFVASPSTKGGRESA